MIKYKQLVFGAETGDCYRACMATLLQLPPIVLPNDHSPMWYYNWRNYLTQFGLQMSSSSPADGPIWSNHIWLASVPSLNLEGYSHAILMDGQKVYHDPSRKKKYRTGMNLLGKDLVISGARLEVSDVTKLHHLDQYRSRVNKP